MIHLDYRSASPIYSQIEQGIRDQIRAGVLRCGDKLPSVRELAASLTINPNTIQRAYRDLEQQGWIVTVSGKGCFVCDRTPAPEKEPLLNQFDQVVSALLTLGMTRQELIHRLEKEEKENA